MMMNSDHQKLVRQCEKNFEESLNKKFGNDWIIYNYDTYQKISIPDLLQISTLIVTEPCLGELKELQEKGKNRFYSPSKNLSSYLEELNVEFFKVEPLKLKLRPSKKIQTIAFRGPDHPMGGLEVFVGIMTYLDPSIKVHIDLTPSMAAALPYNERFSSYYDVRRSTINWPKYRDSLISKLNREIGAHADLLVVPGYNFNVGYDYFLESYAHSGGKIFMAQNAIHDEIQTHNFSTQIFSNYKLGDLDSAINHQIYQILAEELVSLCKI